MIANNDTLIVDENSQNNNINVLANDVASSVLTFESLLDISFPSAIPAGVSDAIDFSLESLDDTFSGTVTDNGIAWQYLGSIDINYTTYELSISIQVSSNNGYSGEMVAAYNATTETFTSTVTDNAGTNLTISSTETDSTYTETINGTVNSYNFNNFSYTEDTSNNTYTVNGGTVTDANGNTINVGTADLSVSSASAANGTVVINSDGTLNYTPNTDFYGTDTITYLSTDGSSTDTATVTVTVTINESHVLDNTVVTAADFNGGTTATFTGDIEAGGNKDQYEFDAVAGHTYTFDAISNGTLGDNYLTLYDANGNTITYNDDTNGYDAQITWTPTASGTYTVEVRAYSSGSTGTYDLQIDVDNHQSQINSDTLVLDSHVNNIPATGFNVLLVLDNSGSMSGEMNDMQEAVTNLLGIYEAVGLNTNIHVVYFDDYVSSSETQLFATNDFTGATTFVNNFYADGGTSYGEAATAAQSALEAFNTNAPDYTNHMFFISDGAPGDSLSAYEDFRSNIATLGIEVNMSALGFAGASTNSMDYFDNTNGAETISSVEELANNLLETLSTSQGGLFFSSNQLLANDTNITNASVTNVSVTSAEGSLVDLGNGYFQYTPSDDERYSNVTNPTLTYTVNYDDISGNNVTATGDFVIQTSLIQSINQGTDSDDSILFTPTLHDSIDGGAGVDTLIATNNFDNYTIGMANNTVIIQDANNFSSFITSIENYQFSDYAYDLTTLAALDAVRPLYETALEIVGGQWSNGYVLPDLFLFPENLDLEALYDYAFTGDDQSDVLFASSSNDYINAQGGMDAVNALAGNDIIDGGLGSNFLFGGDGNDIFFADGRDTANETWTTIADFNNGVNSATLWGYVDGTSSHFWEEDQGAGGAWNGITFRGDLDGDGVVDTSFTFTGLSSGDISMTTGSTGPINGITESYYGFSLV
jgi:uncharacterized protein YegL